MADIVARGIANENGKRYGYVYNEDVGLRVWKAWIAKLKAGAQLFVNVSIIGDSISEGANATVWQTGGYIGLVRSKMQAKYGDAGLGMIPTYYPFNGPLWKYTAGFTEASNWGCASRARTATAAGEKATLDFNGTGVGVVYAKRTDWGTFEIWIDGVLNQTVDTSQATTVGGAVTTITGLTAGAHTLEIRKTSDGKQIMLVGAYEIKGTSGVRVHNCSRYGSIVAEHSPFNIMAASIDVFAPRLTIISLTANDYGTQTSLATYTSGLQQIITRAKATGDVLLLSSGIRTETYSVPQREYVNAMKGLALANNCAYIDLFNRWSGDAVYATNILGYFTSSTVHPNDYGMQDMATAILKVIDEY